MELTNTPVSSVVKNLSERPRAVAMIGRKASRFRSISIDWCSSAMSSRKRKRSDSVARSLHAKPCETNETGIVASKVFNDFDSDACPRP